MDRALVILNPRARRGTATRDYERVRSEVEACFRVRHTLIDSTGQWLRALDEARHDGVERVLSVGGDGTLHTVANAVMASAWPNVALGAIGVGSSNDFHKPCRTRVRGVPVRIGAPVPRDVGLATYEDAAGVTHMRWFFVSASIGFVARANRSFSGGGPLAIARAAASALLRHENIDARIERRETRLSNLSVMLTPYLAGAFRYDTKVPRGRFALHLCQDLERRGLVRAMAKLFCGRFVGETWCARTSMVELERDEDLELDGELFRARRIRFEAVPDALAVCS